MKWALIAVGVLVALVALVAIVGAMSPKDHVATRRARFGAAPDAIWSIISDVPALATWRPGLKKVTVLDAGTGRTTWLEEGEHGAVKFEIVESSAPSRLVVRIAQDDLPFGGSWLYELDADGSGTRVTLTEHGEVKNVIFRFLSRFVFGHHKTLEDYLQGLGKKLGEETRIEP